VNVVSPNQRLLGLAAAAAAALVLGACGGPIDQSLTASQIGPATTSAASPPPQRFSGEAGRAAAAVSGLRRAIADGDVARLCRPGAIFTRGVIRERRQEVIDCEPWVENVLTGHRLPLPTVRSVSVEPDLAVAQVAVGGRTIPLTLLREGSRWLVSFSAGVDPLEAFST
jgi:hypothetical protein